MIKNNYLCSVDYLFEIIDKVKEGGFYAKSLNLCNRKGYLDIVNE